MKLLVTNWKHMAQDTEDYDFKRRSSNHTGNIRSVMKLLYCAAKMAVHAKSQRRKQMINQSIAKEKSVFLLTSSDWHARTIQFIVGILMLALYVWIAAGVLSLLFNLPEILKNGWAQIAEHIIVDIVLILAILELIRILQSYLSVGRVKVTFILDVALVVLIGELIGLWYKDYTMTEVGLHIAAITMLTLLRIVSIRFSPNVVD